MSPRVSRWLDLLDRAFAPVLWPPACDTWLPEEQVESADARDLARIPTEGTPAIAAHRPEPIIRHADPFLQHDGAA